VRRSFVGTLICNFAYLVIQSSSKLVGQRNFTTRWLYCVECPQYSTRLESLGYLCDCVGGRVQILQVVKIICHKAHRRRRRMVHCYWQMTTTCPSTRAHWHHLANTIELVHPSTHSSPQSKRQIDRFSRFCTDGRKCIYFTMRAPIHQNCPFPWGIWTCHVTRNAFGPCERTTQTAPRSVQPSLHRWPRSICIVHNGVPVSPSKLRLPMLASGPHVIRGSLSPPESGTQMVTSSFQPFLQGSLVL